MMSTGLSFVALSALCGLTHGYIDQAQYLILGTVVIMTALVPTVIAQALFYPKTHHLRWGSENPPAELERQAEFEGAGEH